MSPPHTVFMIRQASPECFFGSNNDTTVHATHKLSDWIFRVLKIRPRLDLKPSRSPSVNSQVTASLDLAVQVSLWPKHTGKHPCEGAVRYPQDAESGRRTGKWLPLFSAAPQSKRRALLD